MNAAPARAGKIEDAPMPSEFEGEIREFIRRDVAHLRRPPADPASEQAASNINSLLDRVSGSSVTEIDSLIARAGPTGRQPARCMATSCLTSSVSRR